MRKRRDSPVAKLVTIFLAMLMALALTGMGYGLWSDALNINATVETGTWEVELIGGTAGAGVTCAITQPDTLDIDVDAEAAGSYFYSDFVIHNTGSLPLRIQSITSSSTGGATVIVTGVAEGNVIDAGQVSANGGVEIQVPEPGHYDAVVTITVVLWTQ